MSSATGLSDPAIVCPGLIARMDGKIRKETGLLAPPEVVTVKPLVPAGASAGMATVAVAVVELMIFRLVTFRFVTLPLAAFTVIGAPNPVPVSVTEKDVPAAPNAGEMEFSVGVCARSGVIQTSNRHAAGSARCSSVFNRPRRLEFNRGRLRGLLGTTIVCPGSVYRQ